MDREVTRLCTSREINALVKRKRIDHLAVSTVELMKTFWVLLTTFGSKLVTEWDYIDPFDPIIVNKASLRSEQEITTAF